MIINFKAAYVKLLTIQYSDMKPPNCPYQNLKELSYTTSGTIMRIFYCGHTIYCYLDKLGPLAPFSSWKQSLKKSNGCFFLKSLIIYSDLNPPNYPYQCLKDLLASEQRVGLLTPTKHIKEVGVSKQDYKSKSRHSFFFPHHHKHPLSPSPVRIFGKRSYNPPFWWN